MSTKPSSWVLTALLMVSSALGCNASTHVVECERLHHFSCDCFDSCQTDDRPALDSADAATCAAQLRQDFAQWQVCATGLRANGQRCDEACVRGWGSCAFDVYRQSGLDPASPCEETGG